MIAGRDSVRRPPGPAAAPRTALSVVRLPYSTPAPRRLDAPAGPSHRDVLQRWEEMDMWACSYCDAAFGQTVVAEIDHVIPLAKGGLHEWSNLAPACRECNRSKSDTDVVEWLRDLAGHAVRGGAGDRCDAP